MKAPIAQAGGEAASPPSCVLFFSGASKPQKFILKNSDFGRVKIKPFRVLYTVQIEPLIFTLFRYTSAEQGRRRPTPSFCTADAGGVTTVGNLRRRRRIATAIDFDSPKEHRREN